MYAVDFEFDGRLLSDYNCMICSFDDISGVNTVSAGSIITFNKTSRNFGKLYSLTGVQYDTCIEATFDICKDSDLDNTKYFTNDEYRDLMRWLNRTDGYHQFRLIGEPLDDVCYYNVSFNVEKIIIADNLCGLRLTADTDMPYGYGMEQVIKLSVDSASVGTEFSVRNLSDDIGDILPAWKMTCSDSGEFEMKNLTTGDRLIIKDCVAGEVITFDPRTLVLQSSRERNLWDSFNYEFLKLTNTLEDRENRITVSLPGTVEITYKPIIKDSL